MRRIAVFVGAAVTVCILCGNQTSYASGETPTFDIDYRSLKIRTIGDFLETCEELPLERRSDTIAAVYAVTCISYLRGFFDGHAGAITRQAIRSYAAKEQISVEKTEQLLHDNQEIHAELSERARSRAVICPDDTATEDIAVLLVERLRADGTPRSGWAYFVISGLLQEMFPCG